jgi:pimeloyl-ACP methyl ester carboxylesterase
VTQRESAAESREDRRPLIVFLHGTRLTGAQWAGQIEALDEEFRCLAPDLPGHGDAADVPFTVDVAAERVAAVIEEAGGRAVIVGLSLGGYVAMDVAARWPERVSGLFLAGASAEPVGARAWPYRGLAWFFGSVPDDVLTRVNRWFFAHRYPPAIADPILSGGFYFAGGAVAVRSLVGERFRPRLAGYPGRTLIVNGAFDLLFRASAKSFREAAVDARTVVLPGATHLTNLDRPELFTTAVRRFAREVAASPT